MVRGFSLKNANDLGKFRSIRTFIFILLTPLLILVAWFVLPILSMAFGYDPTGGCNPPGPDGPNCQYCPKATIGCGDVYKNNE